MTFIRIEEGKMDKLSEHIEQSLRHMGKAMQCVDEWIEEGGMKEHSGYGMRGGSYGNRGGYGNRRADMGHQIGASQQMGGGDFYNSQPPNYGQMPMGPDPRMM